MPRKWQKSYKRLASKGSETYVPISRCSSVIALSLEGEPILKLMPGCRRPTFRRQPGTVFDPFGPWYILGITAYPDLKSTTDAYDPARQYTNGPEVFMIMLWAELKDAQTRLTNVYISISRLVKAPPDFLFNRDFRDKLLFEANSLTYTRSYFWSYQSLASLNEDVKTILTAYRDTFTDSVWGGFSGIIWPVEETSTRNINWRKQTAAIKNDVERELQELESIRTLN